MSNHSQHSPILPCKWQQPKVNKKWLGYSSGIWSPGFLEGIFFKNQSKKPKKHKIFPSRQLVDLGSSFNFFWVVLPLMSVFDCSLSLVNSSAALSSDSSVLVADFSKSSRTTCQRWANRCVGRFSYLAPGDTYKNPVGFGGFFWWSNFWIDFPCHWCSRLSVKSEPRPPALRSHHWLVSVCHHSFLQTQLLDPGTKTCENTRCSMFNWKMDHPIENLLVWSATLKLWLKRSVQLIVCQVSSAVCTKTAAFLSWLVAFLSALL